MPNNNFCPTDKQIEAVKEQISTSDKKEIHKTLIKKFGINVEGYKMAKKGIYFLLAYIEFDCHNDFNRKPTGVNKTYLQLILEEMNAQKSITKNSDGIKKCLGVVFNDAYIRYNKAVGYREKSEFEFDKLGDFISKKSDDSQGEGTTRKRSNSAPEPLKKSDDLQDKGTTRERSNSAPGRLIKGATKAFDAARTRFKRALTPSGKPKIGSWLAMHRQKNKSVASEEGASETKKTDLHVKASGAANPNAALPHPQNVAARPGSQSAPVIPHHIATTPTQSSVTKTVSDASGSVHSKNVSPAASTTMDKKDSPRQRGRGFSLSLGHLSKKEEAKTAGSEQRARSHILSGRTENVGKKERLKILKSMISANKKSLANFYALHTNDEHYLVIINGFNDLLGEQNSVQTFDFDKLEKQPLDKLNVEKLDTFIELITKASAYVNEKNLTEKVAEKVRTFIIVLYDESQTAIRKLIEQWIDYTKTCRGLVVEDRQNEFKNKFSDRWPYEDENFKEFSDVFFKESNIKLYEDRRTACDKIINGIASSKEQYDIKKTYSDIRDSDVIGKFIENIESVKGKAIERLQEIHDFSAKYKLGSTAIVPLAPKSNITRVLNPLLADLNKCKENFGNSVKSVPKIGAHRGGVGKLHDAGASTGDSAALPKPPSVGRKRRHSFGGLTERERLIKTLRSMMNAHKSQLSYFYNTYKDATEYDVVYEGIQKIFMDLKIHLNGGKRGAPALYFDKFEKDFLDHLTEDQLKKIIGLMTDAITYVGDILTKYPEFKNDIEKEKLKKQLKDLIDKNKADLKFFYVLYRSKNVLSKKIFPELKKFINRENQKEDILDFDYFQSRDGKLDKLDIDELQKVIGLMNEAIEFMNDELKRERTELKTLVSSNEQILKEFNKKYADMPLAKQLRYWANGKKRSITFDTNTLKKYISKWTFGDGIVECKEVIDKVILLRDNLQKGSESIEGKRKLLKRWYESHKNFIAELEMINKNKFKPYYSNLRNLFSLSEKEVKEHDNAFDVWENSKNLNHINLIQLIYDVFAERFCKGHAGTDSEIDRITKSDDTSGSDVESVIMTFGVLVQRIDNDIEMIKKFKVKFEEFLERIYNCTKDQVEKDKEEFVNGDYLAPQINVPSYNDVYNVVGTLLTNHCNDLNDIKKEADKLK